MSMVRPVHYLRPQSRSKIIRCKDCDDLVVWKKYDVWMLINPDKTLHKCEKRIRL